MGVWREAFLGTAKAELPPIERFGHLLIDLGRERIVQMPWTLIEGQFDVNTMLLWSGGVVSQVHEAGPGDVLTTRHPGMDDPGMFDIDEPPPWGYAPERARVLAKGDAVLELLPVLARAPYGTADLAVVFAHLDFGNPAIQRHYWFQDRRTVLTCYALAHPQDRWLCANALDEGPDGPRHPARVCLVNTFKFGETEVCPAIETVFARHLGTELVHGETRC